MSYAEDVMNDPLHYFHNANDNVPKGILWYANRWAVENLEKYKHKMVKYDQKETQQEKWLHSTDTSSIDHNTTSGGWDDIGTSKPSSESRKNDIY